MAFCVFIRLVLRIHAVVVKAIGESNGQSCEITLTAYWGIILRYEVMDSRVGIGIW